MTREQLTHIAEEIKLKVLRLMDDNAMLLKRIGELEQYTGRLESEIQQQKNTIQTLQTQNKMVKLAEMLPQDAAERQELKKMVTAQIRQIEECIRLLSE